MWCVCDNYKTIKEICVTLIAISQTAKVLTIPPGKQLRWKKH